MPIIKKNLITATISAILLLLSSCHSTAKIEYSKSTVKDSAVSATIITYTDTIFSDRYHTITIKDHDTIRILDSIAYYKTIYQSIYHTDTVVKQTTDTVYKFQSQTAPTTSHRPPYILILAAAFLLIIPIVVFFVMQKVKAKQSPQ